MKSPLRLKTFRYTHSELLILNHISDVLFYERFELLILWTWNVRIEISNQDYRLKVQIMG